jgi:chromosome segregation ATPase
MRNQRADKAMFFPLDTLKSRAHQQQISLLRKELAADVILFEPAIEHVAHHPYGNALVCDTMKLAQFVTWVAGDQRCIRNMNNGHLRD